MKIWRVSSGMRENNTLGEAAERSPKISDLWHHKERRNGGDQVTEATKC